MEADTEKEDVNFYSGIQMTSTPDQTHGSHHLMALQPETNEEKITPRTKKKKSALAKLADRKGRRKHAGSDHESDVGSQTSLQNREMTEAETQQPEDKSLKTKRDLNILAENSIENAIGKGIEEKVEKTDIPMAVDSNDSDEGIVVNNSRTIEDSDVHASQNSSQAPTENTINRFRSLRMASEDSTAAPDSPTRSQFKPKPPPRAKGSKRFHDQNSSSEDVNQESLKPRTRKSPKPEDKNSDVESSSAFGSSTSLVVVKSAKKVDKLELGNDSFEISHNKNVINSKHEISVDEDGNDSDLNKTRTELFEKYEDVLKYDPQPLNAERPSGSSSPMSRLKKLKPISPLCAPPPLASDFTSASLRTSYRTDRPSSAVLHRPAPDTISQRSYNSTSVLPLISTKDARDRSFLVGSINSRCSLLGSEELDRYFPDRKVKIFVGSWNMCEMKTVPDALDDFLLPSTSDFVHDIYVIGTQESVANRREWEIRLQETLGPSHVLFHSGVHGVLYLSIFIRRDLTWFCSVSEEANVSTRAFSMIKTKGGLGVCFTFFGTSFLFVNSHLTPHDDRVKERIADYETIRKTLALPRQVITNQFTAQNEDVTSRFDCVFWCGDLNFRVNQERHKVDRILEETGSNQFPNYEPLLKKDELINAMNEGLIFHEFQEGRINFKPTYRFDIGTDKYDTSAKMRIPSYTDRILYRCRKKNAITCLHYDCASEVQSSDHKPVYAFFEVAIRPGRDNIPLAAGKFEREVYLEATRRRAMHLDNTLKNQKTSSVCSIQ